jgi:hypothetical protein
MRKAQRVEPEPEMDERARVPAFSDMDQETKRAHLNLRHSEMPSAGADARHSIQHAAGLITDHYHLPDAAQRLAAQRADIRRGSIDPVYSETLYITGYDEWGPQDYV